jgi:hypothetical protein
MVYSQDFTSKYDIVIDPNRPYVCSSSVASAELPIQPRCSTNIFVINQNVSSTMTAQNSIILRSGFSAKAGSHFKAVIDGNLCLGSRSTQEIVKTDIIPFAGQSTLSSNLPDFEKPAAEIEEYLGYKNIKVFNVYPNPTHIESSVNIQIQGYPLPAEIRLASLDGKILKQIRVEKNITTIYLPHLSSGYYIVHYISENTVPLYRTLSIHN